VQRCECVNTEIRRRPRQVVTECPDFFCGTCRGPNSPQSGPRLQLPVGQNPHFHQEKSLGRVVAGIEPGPASACATFRILRNLVTHRMDRGPKMKSPATIVRSGTLIHRVKLLPVISKAAFLSLSTGLQRSVSGSIHSFPPAGIPPSPVTRGPKSDPLSPQALNGSRALSRRTSFGQSRFFNCVSLFLHLNQIVLLNLLQVFPLAFLLKETPPCEMVEDHIRVTPHHH
jgi:hypothetical protein